MQRRRRSRPMVAFCACADTSLLPVSNEVLVRCGSEGNGVKCRLVNLSLHVTINVAYDSQYYSTDGNSLCAKHSFQAKRRKLTSSHRASQASESCKGSSPWSRSRPTRLSLTRLSEQRSVAQVSLARSGECGIALSFGGKCALMHTAAGFASCAFGLLITCMHAVFRVLVFPCIFDVLGAGYADVPREPLSLPYCRWVRRRV